LYKFHLPGSPDEKVKYGKICIEKALLDIPESTKENSFGAKRIPARPESAWAYVQESHVQRLMCRVWQPPPCKKF